MLQHFIIIWEYQTMKCCAVLTTFFPTHFVLQLEKYATKKIFCDSCTCVEEIDRLLKYTDVCVCCGRRLSFFLTSITPLEGTAYKKIFTFLLLENCTHSVVLFVCVQDWELSMRTSVWLQRDKCQNHLLIPWNVHETDHSWFKKNNFCNPIDWTSKFIHN